MKIDDLEDILSRDLDSLTLLIVAGPASRRQSLNAFVVDLGIGNVHKAGNAVEAIDILRRKKIDIAIIDLTMSLANKLRTIDFMARSQGPDPEILEVIIEAPKRINGVRRISLALATISTVPNFRDEAELYEGVAAAIERIMDRGLRGCVRMANDRRDEASLPG